MKRTGSPSLTSFPKEEPARERSGAVAQLLPAPMRRVTAWRWVRSTAADFALVGLNWLLVGALLVPLRTLFPRVRVFAYDAGLPGSLLGIALLNASLITMLIYTEGLYGEPGDLGKQGRIVGKSVLLATALLTLAYSLQGATWAADSLFYGVGVLNFGTLWTWRRVSQRHRTSSANVQNVLIVGRSSVGRRVASYVEEHPEAGRAFCGFLDDEQPLGNGVVGRVNELPRLARAGFVDEVILAAPHDGELTRQVLRDAQRLRLNVEIIPELFGHQPKEEEIERVANFPLICLHSERLPVAGLIFKRLLDSIGAAVALILLSPLLAVLAGLIRVDSPGPVFYRAPRAGRKGKPFRCFKFRTMVNNADALKDGLRQSNQRSGPFFKMVNDPRITRVGRFLRRYSLDELPQLWNVLRGEMSLVGPRPHPLDDLAGYEVKHLARLDVTPGMTGLWQVTARRDPSFERGIELDRHYIQTWSLKSDLRILLQTALVVVRGSGD